MTHLFKVIEVTCTQERHQSVDIVRSIELDLIKLTGVLKPHGNDQLTILSPYGKEYCGSLSKRASKYMYRYCGLVSS